jgi:hypothetical protein
VISRLWLWFVLGSSIAVVSLVVLDVDSAIRPFVVVVFLIVAPGTAIVRLLKIPDRIAELTLGIALSAAIDGTVPGVLMYAGFWSSDLALLIVIGITLAATFLEARSRRRTSA